MSHDQPTVIVDSGASYEQTPADGLASILHSMSQELKNLTLDDFKVLTSASVLLKVQQTEIQFLNQQIRNLEAQVYGGTTK